MADVSLSHTSIVGNVQFIELSFQEHNYSNARQNTSEFTEALTQPSHQPHVVVMAFSTAAEEDAINYLIRDSPKIQKVVIANAEAAITTPRVGSLRDHTHAQYTQSHDMYNKSACAPGMKGTRVAQILEKKLVALS
jgi:hypothetical protein